MKKLLVLALIALALPAAGQRVKLGSTTKCDAYTAAELRRLPAKGAGEVKLIAKVTPDFDAGRLRAEGITVGAEAGDVVALRVEAADLWKVEQNGAVVQYSIARRVQPTMNRTRFDTRTDSVQAGAGLPQAYTGEGVLIGVTDWGFDYRHPNYNNNGESNRRLLRAWDQFRLSGPAPAGFDYGTEIVGRADLLTAKGDTAGLYGYATHGTHVAGICAGRGIEGNYTGQAPGANLLFASFHLDEYSWMDAVAWMRNVAKEEGKRLVVNSSWGMYTLGPIDGTSLLSQAINNWSDSGVVFVTSGGNCGDDQFHVSKRFVPGTADTMHTFAAYYTNTEITGQSIALWGEPQKAFRAEVTIISGSDTAHSGWYATEEGDFFLDSLLIAGDDTVGFDLTMERENPFNSRPHAHFNVGYRPGCTIFLSVTAEEGTVHGWNVCNLANGAGNMGAQFESKGVPGYTRGDDEYGIGEPGCVESCITVAAHTADSRKPNGSPNYGPLASFSSHGPTLDGRQKPDLSAPGVQVVSSISSMTTESYSPTMTYSYGGTRYIWARMSGTSMSGPAVTGIAALMLEANPSLTARQVREILCLTARNDTLTGPLHDADSASTQWGWGKADALAAVNEALARVDIAEAGEEWFAKSLQVFPNPATAEVRVLTGRHDAERVQFYTMDGRLAMEATITLDGTADVSRLTPGLYIVKCGPRTAKLLKL